jgi:hypothetical protein
MGSALSDSDLLQASLCLSTLAPDDTLRVVVGKRTAERLMPHRHAVALSPSEVSTLVVSTAQQARRLQMFGSADPTSNRREPMLAELRTVLCATLRESGTSGRCVGSAGSGVGVALLLALHLASGAEELMGALLVSKLSRAERGEVDDIRARIEDTEGVDVLMVRALIDALVATALRQPLSACR